MADRTFLWGGGSSSMRRATELGGRRRHDQQRLLVELELDDSLYENSQRLGVENSALYQDERRSTYAGDARHSRHHSNGQHYTVVPKQPLPSRNPRETTTRPLTERQMQQLNARRLSSPYKLKQEVLGTRNDLASQRHHQRFPHSSSTGSLQRVSRSSSLQQTPAGLVIESVQQNIHLRDQVMAHLQQELMGVQPLHRASHMEKNVPQRVVKLLNRMRSLSLAVVEAVVYLSNELGTNLIGATVENDILERDFYGYLLKMASSDTDFLACSPPLQRFFGDFEVNLTRNPFVDGLSLDSSEVLLCSCHQSASSDVLFSSASSSSSSLLRLLTHKLETFSLQAQRFLPRWQILPAERVAAALLHLMDLETRFNAVQMLPRYLQSHSGYRRHLNRPIHQHHELEGNYGTFGGGIAQRLGHKDHQVFRSDHDLPRSNTYVVEAWAGSPTANSSTGGKSASNQPSLAQSTDDCSRRLLSIPRESRGPSAQDEVVKPLLPSQAWIPPTNSIDFASVRANASLKSSGSPLPSTARNIPGADVGNEESAQLVLPQATKDMMAAAKSSSRSEGTASEKKDRSAKEKHNPVVDVGVQMSVRSTTKEAVDVGIQMTQRNRATVATTQTTNRSVISTSVRSLYDEGLHVRHDYFEEDIAVGIHVSQLSTATATTTQTSHRSANSISARSRQDEGTRERDDTTSGLVVSLSQPEIDATGDFLRSPALLPNASESLELVEHLSSVGSDDLLVVNSTEPVFLVPPMVKPLVLSRTAMEGGNRDLDASATANQVTIPVQSGGEAEQGNEDTYECDFEYSSNEALSSIAMALQMLPNFTLLAPESALVNDVLKPEEAIPVIETASLMSIRAQQPLMELTDNIQVCTPMQTLLEDDMSMEHVVTEPEGVKQSEEAPPLEDEFSYSSSSAISNIAMALSLLPGASRDDIFSVPEVESELEIPLEANSPRISTYRSIGPRLQELTRAAAGEFFMEEALDYGPLVSARSDVLANQQIYPVSSSFFSCGPSHTTGIPANPPPLSFHTNGSVENCDQGILCEIPSVLNRELERSDPTSSRSVVLAATSYQGDGESEQSDFSRIFELCRDIQGTAFDMSHWVSHREVKDQIQSFAQPYSSLMGYTSPVKSDNAPKYLERELKMLRRNLAWWKIWVVDHKRAKVVVRRLVARRKVRQFVNYHHWRRLQARMKEESDRQFHAASRIQRNWKIYCYRRGVSARKDTFRVVHMAFYRAKFYVNISKRRRRREYAKEKVVRWWRRQLYHIKKKQQRLDKLSRERERRIRALREIQKFLKEILLRRRLKAAQEMAKNILFKEQLKWTKAKRDVEKSMKLNSKHKKELIADMDARLAELDKKWKAAEDGRLQLLSHHDRVVQQQQQTVEVRRRRLAALKLQMFFRVCHLHKKLHRAEVQKQQYQTRLQEELRVRQLRDFETQKHISQSRTQARVLEKKLDRLAEQAVKADTAHRKVIQDHLARERTDQERYARQKIKAFIDFRVLRRRSETERRHLMLEQVRIQAEKAEIELMSSEEQREQRRTALSTAYDLQQRLYDMEARSENLRAAKDQLALEKAEERRQAAEALEQRRLEASMLQITSWVSGQMQLSRLKKEQAAITALAVRELEEEKQKHRKVNEAKTREIASIKASNLLHQRTSQHRNQKAVETIRIQHQQKTAQEKVIAARTRIQLVQLVIDVKILTEQESTRGISQALAGVAQFYKDQLYKFARLKLLRSKYCARRILRIWRQWIHVKRVESAQQLALVKLEDGKQRQTSARRAQAWWRKWAKEQRIRRERKRIFDEHLYTIRRRASARRIQGVWRRWVQSQQKRRHQQRLAFDKHLDTIRVRANVRRIQGLWRRWVKREIDRKRQQQLAFEAHLEQIRVRANVRKIQGVWRRWVKRERERRIEQKLAAEARLEVIRTRANVCRIQRVWRRWSLREQGRRAEQQLTFTSHVEELRFRVNARKIQREWRLWVQGERVRKHVQRLAFEAQLKIIHMRAMIRKIQKVWRHWIKAECERRQ
ncbi:hypothetical protein P3T76_004494 [Phytophthora citrophthora]|uniref:Uncharacterized protein n=1 Tax=Phytophthora citrophthora TaxID=4793 RepID=A0AAD9GTP8_9STRA|nr:hypothetical protein P3T76_004494 [Phytophthora citrophthora]